MGRRLARFFLFPERAGRSEEHLSRRLRCAALRSAFLHLSPAGAHRLSSRRHGVGGDRFARGPELLLHLPGRGHRSHGVVYHPHGSYHHCRAAPRQLLGSVRTPPARPHPTPLDLPSAFFNNAADPTGALHTRSWGYRTSIHPKLGLHGTSTEPLALWAPSESSSSGTPPKLTLPRTPLSWIPGKFQAPNHSRSPFPLNALPPGEIPWFSAWQPGD